MKSSAPSFTESDTVGGTYKGSLFKNLFKDRKTLLEGYPAVKKGLAFPEPCLKFGSTTYSFKTTDVADKVACKHDGQEFAARYKKETGKWDLSVKSKMCGMTTLCKYEERGSGSPHYVGGVEWCNRAMATNCKFKPATGVFKGSLMYNCDDFLKGVKLAGDLKANLMDLNPALMKYNIGASYANGAGLSIIALSDKGLVTLNHSLQVDKKTSAILEFVAATGETPAVSPITLGVGYQLDKSNMLRMRVNQMGQVQACLKKDFSPNLSLLCAGTIDVGKMNSMMAPPALGFKIVTKA